MEDLALQSVRKPKAKKTHLTVPAPDSADVRTLCGVEMKSGDYELVEGDADCQPCLRKRGNRAFISSAYFAQDAGTRLLEMSVAQARAGRSKAKAKPRPAPASPPSKPRREPAASQGPGQEQLSALGIERLEAAGSKVYRSPAGVLVRVQQDSRGWSIAEVTFDGPARVSRGRSGTTCRLGDLELIVDEASSGLRVVTVD